MITREGWKPTSSGHPKKTTIEHVTQSFTPATCPQQPRYASMWKLYRMLAYKLA
jgi:hypothetical protein